ncbi:hypothetical protein [Mycobacterium xenopi]|uniref:Uncharacterized protein n=2 Tax=Mycobacterium xenopi TaxID=1789 RepID=A0AAD1GWD3_MYCXE|nr:hypothetical protein [Mycobacterium xenopi]MDA3641801.1 hypothetical protein [Mycobacterium xenopi]MDA3659724.1 hypothetical protein [Mycobacterium xenopi]MDA3664092.1 hypothetical protein [Mycobacterium xenopi]ORX13676.1 hypothetical protein AWC32_14780 [Mycobacterium xenopi]SPX79625.1 Uncharacterised protein [Mycobacterium xenopi]
MSAKALRVDTEALRAMSARWASMAGNLQIETPEVTAASCASATAVAAGDAEISAASAMLGSRVRAGAAKVAQSAEHYDTNEAASASKMVALGKRRG